MVNNLRMALVGWLWKLKRVWRRFCWADAVTWALGYGWSMHKSNIQCFYCLACNTDQEIKDYGAKKVAINQDESFSCSVGRLEFFLVLVGLKS
jgi:hypothetical protein